MLNRRRMIALSLATALSDLHAAHGAPPVVRLVFVHGRGQAGLDPEVLKTAWLSALSAGAQALGKSLPTGLEVAFPFYGDILEDFVRKADLPLAADVVARGGHPNNNFLAFQAEVAQSIRAKAGVTDDQVLAEYGDNPKERGPLNWDWVQAIFRAIDKHAQGLSADAIERFTRDVYLYVDQPDARNAVDSIVHSALNEKPTIVVAHSLGTVVAYNVLRAETRPLKVSLLTTVGSPLGIRAIRDQLAPIAYPPHLGRWYNAYDTRDVVALYPLDNDNFPVDPPIDNYQGVRNQTENRHGIEGYLNDKHVAAQILDAFGT